MENKLTNIYIKFKKAIFDIYLILNKFFFYDLYFDSYTTVWFEFNNQLVLAYLNYKIKFFFQK